MKLIRSAALAATLLATAVTANAGLIASDNTPITISGQGYSQLITINPTSFTDVTLTLDVYGDFGDTQPDEHFKFFIDGLQLVDLHSSSHAGFSAVSAMDCCSWNFTGAINIDNAVWDSFDSDGILNISWQNGNGVGINPTANYVNWSLNGAEVPEPASIALLGLGLFGLGMSRKKKA